MYSQIFSSKEAYRFIKAEQFFNRYKEWEQLGSVVSHAFDVKTETLTLNFNKRDGKPCALFIHFPHIDSFQVLFHPGNLAVDHPLENTRSVVHDNFDDFRMLL